MGTVISLDSYRTSKRRLYMERHGTRLQKFIEAFVLLNFKTSFAAISQDYLAQRVHNNEEAWDYYDFRDLIRDGIMEVFGDQVWNEIRRCHWFDPQWISKEEVIDKLVSFFILGKTNVAS